MFKFESKGTATRRKYTYTSSNTNKINMKDLQRKHDKQEEGKKEERKKRKGVKICTDSKKDAPWNTGYFHDGVRRVDLVLVMQYSEVDTCEFDVEGLQVNCLMDLADAGLDLELEPGTGWLHGNLVFVKLHCPEDLIKEYGTNFDVRKFFRPQHMQYMQESIAAEIDIISLVRAQYPEPVGYTTWERSIIVYRMLRVMTFNRTIEDAPSSSYVRGLQCLLDNKVVTDVFALHDGPYFMLPGQEVENANARQALFYTWLGWSNIYRCQPTHLIREYFGERVAFVFAFSETLVKVLAVLSAIGALAFIIDLYRYEETHVNSYISVCNINLTKYWIWTFPEPAKPKTLEIIGGMTICPSCRDYKACPFRDLSTYCHEVTFKTLLDSPSCSVAALLAAIICWVFFFKWWRREEQFTWLWEVPVASSLNTTRVNYHKNNAIIPTGTHFCARLQRSIVVILAVGIILCVNILLITFNNKLVLVTIDLDKEFGDFYRRKYLILMIMGMMNGAVISLLEWPYRWLGHKLAKTANKSTDEDFEWSLLLKRCGLAFLINYSLFYFYGVVKGSLYTYPSDPKRWNIFLGLGMVNCGVLGCIDELVVVVVVTAATCRSFTVLTEIFQFECTDYNNYCGRNEPCWEREYRLKPFKESAVLELIYRLLMKYIHSTMLMAVIPLAPFVILATLLWDIRSEARRLLLCRRRPLLVKSYGLGAWRWLLALLPLLIGLSNAVIFALNTDMFDTLLYKVYLKPYYYYDERWFSFIPYYMLTPFWYEENMKDLGNMEFYLVHRTIKGHQKHIIKLE